MHYCDIGGNQNAADYDTLFVFTLQLRKIGIDAYIHTDVISGKIQNSHRYDCAGLLTSKTPEEADSLVILNGQNIGPDMLARLRKMKAVGGAFVFGDFQSAQSEFTTASKLSYVLGIEPKIIQNPVLRGMPIQSAPLAVMDQPKPIASFEDKPRIGLVGIDVNTDEARKNIISLAASQSQSYTLLLNGKSKQIWSSNVGPEIPAFRSAELMPGTLSNRFDILVLFEAPPKWYRMQLLIAQALVNGCLIIDATPKHLYAQHTQSVIKGPPSAGLLSHWLSDEILPQLQSLRDDIQKAGFVRDILAQRNQLLSRLKDRSIESKPEVFAQERTIFVPTNGVGLGHAQRCSLIASEMKKDNPAFAAFPSCMPMLNRYGFDTMPLLSRSNIHVRADQNDLINHQRLDRLGKDFECLVFDGGYVFDSIYRTIADNDLRSVWVRRGLWQEGQDNSIALDREKIFDRVIVPLEAFDELNASYSFGNHLRTVSPIVQSQALDTKARKAVRKSIETKFGRQFDNLVITMLGGGVAADRKSQLATIAGLIESRDDTLNLIVVWPTATVETGLFHLKNSAVVRTHHASVLLSACDLFISAVGYNSFHEAMYKAVPTIFMPQMAAFMDDQAARANAAVERELAIMVEPDELAKLSSEITLMLDKGQNAQLKANLEKLNLPAPGNRKAASIIQELVA